MGGFVSTNKLYGDEREDRKQIRKHEEHNGGWNDDASEGILEGDHLKALRWYHWLIYDMRFRIFYSTFLALALGIGLPLLIYFLAFNNDQKLNYGSCLINAEYRFECLVNSEQAPLEQECYDALCCWMDDDSLPFKCHHSFPPGYQYQVSSVMETPKVSQVELTLEPKNSPTLLPLKVKLTSVGGDHLEIHFYNPGNPETSELPGIKMEGGPFVVNYSPAAESFHVHLQRLKNGVPGETIFDTRLGPVISTNDSLSFSTVLPSEFFWGLRGGHGDGTETYAVVNGPGSHELPFYMSMEQNGDFHGVLIETVAPFIFQFIEAPGVLFHFQTTSDVKLHFFPGPTPAQVYKQLHKWLKQRREEEDGGTEISHYTSLPPYWALGLHLCRVGFNATSTLDEMTKLEEGQIPYDSDCVDESMRRPFAVDLESYPQAGTAFILSHLEHLGKRIILSQKMGLELDGNQVGAPLILNRDGVPLVGNSTHNNETVVIVYPDYLNGDILPWVAAELGSTLDYFDGHFGLLAGLVLVDNFPSTTNGTQLCGNFSGVDTRLGETFAQLNLICADGQHSNTNLTKYPETSHLSLHNVFGQVSLEVLRKAFESSLHISNQRVPMVGVSTWTELGIQDGFAGLQVPFTWAGLVDSMSHLLRNFALNPSLVGTPICGSFVIPEEELAEGEEEVTRVTESGDVLCLRWFQLGLLFPFARNRRGLDGIKGPLDLGFKYRRYLISAIRSRYRFNPYYYTRLYESEVSAEPLIRPLIFDFYSDPTDFNVTKSLLTQFMIGNALMAAPILSGAISREVYFPRGKWYDLHGNLIVDAYQGGKTLTVPSVLSEIPVFIRGGGILPTVDEFNGNSAVETRGNYRILATFPDDPSSTSTGTLYVDDGVSLDSISGGKFNNVTFTGTTMDFRVQASGDCSWAGPSGISTTIDEIKIIGFLNPGDVEEVESNPPMGDIEFIADWVDEETQTLRITNLTLNWCLPPFNDVTFTWTYKNWRRI